MEFSEAAWRERRSKTELAGGEATQLHADGVGRIKRDAKLVNDCEAKRKVYKIRSRPVPESSAARKLMKALSA
jgi:hypothetical protein